MCACFVISGVLFELVGGSNVFFNLYKISLKSVSTKYMHWRLLGVCVRNC